MSEVMVRVLKQNGSAGPEFQDVPLSEVPPGFIPGKMVGFGECYVNPESLQPDPVVRHDAFPEPVRESIRRIMNALARVQPQTLDEWESGFRCDTHPWTEIALYERMAEAMERFGAHLSGDDELTNEKRRDIFAVILAFTNGGPTPAGYSLSVPATLTAKRVKDIERWMFSETVVAGMGARGNHLRDLIMPDRLAGPDRVHISALFGEGVEMNMSSTFNPRELVASADVILGVDIDSDHEFVVYGRDRLRRVIGSGESEMARVLRIELDQESDELEKLIALVQVVKGSHDYE
jgi:hypothetical protein